MKKSVKVIIITLSTVLALNFGVENINVASKNNQYKCELTNIGDNHLIDPVDKN